MRLPTLPSFQPYHRSNMTTALTRLVPRIGRRNPSLMMFDRSSGKEITRVDNHQSIDLLTCTGSAEIKHASSTSAGREPFDVASISSAEMYSIYLLANWPFASIEAALESAGIRQVLPDWDKRRRREALADDLRQHGMSPPGISRLAVDCDRGSPLGWSYVLEGSRLGAGMILRAIDRPDEVMLGTRFLRHGNREHLWQSFKVALSEIDGDPVAVSNACAGAKLAFQCFLATTSR
jgi:heme oxygenase